MRSTRPRRALSLGVATALIAAVAVQSPSAGAVARRGVLLSESFSGASVSTGVWSAVSPKGSHTPCLTAATKNVAGSLAACNTVVKSGARPDAPGTGTFQLTDNTDESGGDAGVLVLNQAQNARAGLHISFDMFMYNAHQYSGRGGDGISFYLVDGAQQTVATGLTGGSLGYQNIPGAFVGVGFDEYGNFSNPAYFPKGDKGPGQVQNAIVLRGAASTGYQYLDGEPAPAPLAVDGARSRASAKRTVTIDVSTRGIMSVYVDFNDGSGRRKVIDSFDLDHIPGQPALPETIKLGFAGSTWAATAYHEISNFSVAQLDPDLNLTLGTPATFKAGGSGTLTATVANAESAGPTNGTETTTINMPPGLTATGASGPGWTCSTGTTQVSCSRQDPLQPGSSYPPISITTKAANPGSAEVTVTGTATVPNEHDPSDNSAALKVPIAPGPDLSFTLSSDGPTITGTTSNAPGAGPSDQPVTMTIPIPQGAIVKKLTPGPGWTCTQGSGAVNCTRPDPLAPGSSFPPVQVTLGTPGGVPLTVPVSGRTDTPNDGNPANNAAGPLSVAIPAIAPDLAVKLSDNGPFLPDQVGNYTINVSNSVSAGPTTGTVTVSQSVPRGLTYVTAYGDFWSCALNNTTVTCTRPGTGSDALAPGASYPPITVRFQSPPSQVTSTATVSTPADSGASNNSSAATTAIG